MSLIMSTRLSTRVLSALVDARDREAGAVVLSFAYFFCLLGSYYIIRPVRETMGTVGGTSQLSWLFTGTFVTMLAAVPLFGAAVARLPRHRFVPLVYRFFLVAIVIFAALIRAGVAEARVAQAFFIWTSVFNLFVVSVFWSVMADIFRSDQGKRLFGFIAAGGTLGSLVVSWFTAAFADDIGLTGLLVMSAILLEGAAQCAKGLFRMGGRVRSRDVDATASAPGDTATASSAAVQPPMEGTTTAEPMPIGGGLLSGITRVVRSPYLMGICLYILCLTVTATVFYFQQAHIVRSTFADPEVKTAFFALINLAVGLLAVLMQVLLTGRLLRWLSLGAVLALLPLLTGVGLAGLAWAPTLMVLAVFESARRAANYAIAHPSREILFTVVSREDKYKSKNFIDTVVYRGGDMVAGWAYSGLVWLGLGLSAIALAAVPVALLWLMTGLLLGRKQEKLSHT